MRSNFVTTHFARSSSSLDITVQVVASNWGSWLLRIKPTISLGQADFFVVEVIQSSIQFTRCQRYQALSFERQLNGVTGKAESKHSARHDLPKKNLKNDQKLIASTASAEPVKNVTLTFVVSGSIQATLSFCYWDCQNPLSRWILLFLDRFRLKRTARFQKPDKGRCLYIYYMYIYIHTNNVLLEGEKLPALTC